MSVLRVKDKSKHSGEKENEAGLDPALIILIDCYTSVAQICVTTSTFHQCVLLNQNPVVHVWCNKFILLLEMCDFRSLIDR